MAGTRVVSLREKPKSPPGPFIRLSRAEDGVSFVVGCVGKDGTEDFRSQSEHPAYDAALKDAQERAHRVRLPLEDVTGIEPVQKSPPVARRTNPKAVRSTSPAAVGRKSSAELPLLSKQFNLPEIDADSFDRLDPALIVDKSAALHRETRDEYLAIHAELYGDSRNHVCTFTQKTYDQIQGQFVGLFDHLLTVQAVLYSYLEAAFARIEQLENGGKGLSYAGVWKAGEYTRGQFVSHQGSLWHCNRTTQGKPGEDPEDFTLAVKRGKDGKDVTNAAKT